MVRAETPRTSWASDPAAPAPVLQARTAVCVLDVERPVEALRLALADGRPYRWAMLIVRRDRRPLATPIVPLDESGRASASELRAVLASAIGASPRVEEPIDPPPREGARPLVSVVVTTCGIHARLSRCVESVLACAYERLEVIVVDNRPEQPATVEALVESFANDARVRYVQEARPGLSYARNTGLSLAIGEIVAFTDDDVVVDEAWLSSIVDAFTPEVSCVTGLILPFAIDSETQALFERFAGFGKGLERRVFQLGDGLNDPLFPYAPGMFGSGANTAVRRSVAQRLGGFDVNLGAGTAACGGEDLDMYIRLLHAGERIVYEPAAILFHEHPFDSDGLRQRVFKYGVGLTAMFTKQLRAGPRLPLIRSVPAGIHYARDSHSRKNASRGAGYPRTLTVLERLGMAAGPVAYLRSITGRTKPSSDEMPVVDSSPFVPSAVRAIDLDRAVTDVDLGHSAEGREYGGLVALVRLHGDPLAMIEVSAPGGRITADALTSAVLAGAREKLEWHATVHGCLAPDAIAEAGLARGLPSDRCPARRGDEVELPFVSVIVPTTRRPERIETCLESLLALRYPHFEILVVDNAPEDPQTRAVVRSRAREDERVRYLAESRPGSSVARNRGIREARGEILAFTDDDVVVDGEWLRWMIEPFLHDARVGVVTGLVLPARFDTPDQRWFEELSGFGKGFEPRCFDRDVNRADERLLYPYWGGVFGSGNSMAFRPALLERIGGFDPALGAGSRALAGADIEAFSHAILIGSRLAYEPRAVCWHDHRADAAAVDRQMFNYGVGLTAILTKWLLRDPRLAWAIVRQCASFLTPRVRSRDATPHELSRLGRQLRMNRRRNTLGLQIRGYCSGPVLYARSVVWARRLRLRSVLRTARPSDE